ncbi:hypothetical protein CY35_18G023900 [Sphagnum magellanicum]|nr:hypothetical protein CY35_18G023900 [Sphagnum magellanicum]
MQNPWAAAAASGAKRSKGDESTSEKKIDKGSLTRTEVVVTGKAHQLATAWVRNMTGGADFDAEEEAALPDSAEPEVRPIRVGLGAKYLPHAKGTHAAHQVEQKLRAKITGSKGHLLGSKATGSRANRAPRNEEEDEEDEAHKDNEDDGGGSRASSFKKRPIASVGPAAALVLSEQTASKKRKKRKGKVS